MKTENEGRSFDVQAFAQAGGIRQQQDALAGFPRLMDETGGAGGERLVRWRVVGEARPLVGRADQIWLHLTGETLLPLTCQRCLEAVDVALSIDRSFRFAADEATAAAEDELAEDEDVLVLDRAFDLIGLVEDELLMELPLVPRHEVCPTEVKLELVDPGFDDAQAAKPNPFEVLSGFKLEPPKDGR